MPHINLLPWREEERRRKQKEFINIAAGTAVVMLGVIVLVHLQVAGMITNQDNRNKYMDEQIAIVDKEIAEITTLEKEKAALLARMKVIQELQGTRPVIVHIFDEIAKNLPEQAFLLKMQREGNKINLEGVADSNDYVSQFMRNLNDSAWLTNPKLTVIESGKKEYPEASWFQLSVSQVDIEKLKAEKDAKATR
ncbi:PilN domain-containing protein [Kaarinaea lacus]